MREGVHHGRCDWNPGCVGDAGSEARPASMGRPSQPSLRAPRPKCRAAFLCWSARLSSKGSRVQRSLELCTKLLATLLARVASTQREPGVSCGTVHEAACHPEQVSKPQDLLRARLRPAGKVPSVSAPSHPLLLVLKGSQGVPAKQRESGPAAKCPHYRRRATRSTRSSRSSRFSRRPGRLAQCACGAE